MCFGEDGKLLGTRTLGRTQGRACLAVGSLVKHLSASGQHQQADRLAQALESWLEQHGEGMVLSMLWSSAVLISLSAYAQCQNLFLSMGGQRCLMPSSCLESQGCHLSPLFYMLSSFSVQFFFSFFFTFYSSFFFFFSLSSPFSAVFRFTFLLSIIFFFFTKDRLWGRARGQEVFVLLFVWLLLVFCCLFVFVGFL